MIQCVSLNPALQRTLTVEHLRVNSVNRVLDRPVEGSAGKGINAARAIHALGHTPVITGFCGGATGEVITTTLERENLDYEMVQTANKTRICTTILEPSRNTYTEIVEEGLPVEPAEVEAMTALYRKRLQNCDLVTLSGSVPQGVPATIYRDYVALAADRQIPALVDTQKALLRECLPAHPFLIKINREELAAAFETNLATEDDLTDLLRRVERQGGQWMVITDGARPTIVRHRDEQWQVLPPTLQALNPIGAGDVMLGGIAAALAEGHDALEAVRRGAACGSASTLTKTPGHIRHDDVTRLLAETRVIQTL